MSIDILQFNAIAKKIEVKRNTLKEKTLCRDSAVGAQIAYDSSIAYYDALIDSADSFIANNERDLGFTADSDHYSFYNNQCHCFGYKAIKDLGDFADSSGAVTTICVGTFSGRWNQGFCCNFQPPNGTTRLGLEIQAPGGPSKMVNCCGGSNWGPTGAYLGVVLNIDSDAGTTDLTLCAGCSCCCKPYCCGYALYQSCPSYVCGTLNGNSICLRANSPIPVGCMEAKNRQLQSGNRCNCSADLCQQFGNYGNCTGWDNYHICCNPQSHLHKKHWYSQCLCGSGGDTCGSSVCNESYNVCFMSRCKCQHVAQDLPHILQDQALDPSFCVFYNGTGTAEADNSGPISGVMVQGSCFSVPGLFTGGSGANNCYWHCNPGSPFCKGAGMCCMCHTNCCPGCLWAADECSNTQIPGMGGFPSTACGGGTGLYSDPGRMGAVRIKYC